MCITSSYPVHPRLKKIGASLCSFYKPQSYPNIKYLAWDRMNEYQCGDVQCYVYKSNVGYNNKFKKLIGLLGFLIYLKKKIKEFQPDILVCRYVDMAFLGVISKGKSELIYDVNDLPTYGNACLDGIIELIEKKIVSNFSFIILSSRFFQSRYDNLKIKSIVLENKPLKGFVKKGVYNFPKKRLIISFIGVLRFYDIMKNMVDASKAKDIDLIFFGSGPDECKLKEFVTENRIANVYFTGSYDFRQIHEFYNISDYVWAAYPTDNIGVKKAISNKFYECLAFKKPGIFSSNALLAQIVEKHKIGYCVDPYDVNSIENLIDNLIMDKQTYNVTVQNIETYIFNNSVYWEDMIEHQTRAMKIHRR